MPKKGKGNRKHGGGGGGKQGGGAGKPPGSKQSESESGETTSSPSKNDSQQKRLTQPADSLPSALQTVPQQQQQQQRQISSSNLAQGSPTGKSPKKTQQPQQEYGQQQQPKQHTASSNPIEETPKSKSPMKKQQQQQPPQQQQQPLQQQQQETACCNISEETLKLKSPKMPPQQQQQQQQQQAITNPTHEETPRSRSPKKKQSPRKKAGAHSEDTESHQHQLQQPQLQQQQLQQPLPQEHQPQHQQLDLRHQLQQLQQLKQQQLQQHQLQQQQLQQHQQQQHQLQHQIHKLQHRLQQQQLQEEEDDADSSDAEAPQEAPRPPGPSSDIIEKFNVQLSKIQMELQGNRSHLRQYRHKNKTGGRRQAPLSGTGLVIRSIAPPTTTPIIHPAFRDMDPPTTTPIIHPAFRDMDPGLDDFCSHGLPPVDPRPRRFGSGERFPRPQTHQSHSNPAFNSDRTDQSATQGAGPGNRRHSASTEGASYRPYNQPSPAPQSARAATQMTPDQTGKAPMRFPDTVVVNLDALEDVNLPQPLPPHIIDIPFPMRPGQTAPNLPRPNPVSNRPYAPAITPQLESPYPYEDMIEDFRKMYSARPEQDQRSRSTSFLPEPNPHSRLVSPSPEDLSQSLGSQQCHFGAIGTPVVSPERSETLPPAILQMVKERIEVLSAGLPSGDGENSAVLNNLPLSLLKQIFSLMPLVVFRRGDMTVNGKERLDLLTSFLKVSGCSSFDDLKKALQTVILRRQKEESSSEETPKGASPAKKQQRQSSSACHSDPPSLTGDMRAHPYKSRVKEEGIDSLTNLFAVNNPDLVLMNTRRESNSNSDEELKEIFGPGPAELGLQSRPQRKIITHVQPLPGQVDDSVSVRGPLQTAVEPLTDMLRKHEVKDSEPPKPKSSWITRLGANYYERLEIKQRLGKSAFKNSKEFFCSVCNERFRWPHLLNCFHRLCFPCVVQRYDREQNHVKCHICKTITKLDDHEGPEGLFLDYTLCREMCEKLMSPFVCTLCRGGKDSDKYCETCVGYLCMECQLQHDINPALSSHKVGPIYKIGTNSNDVLTPMCSVHIGEFITMFCTTCRDVVCEVCITGEHGDHDIQSMESVIDNVSFDLKKHNFDMKDLYRMCTMRMMNLNHCKQMIEVAYKTQRSVIGRSCAEYNNQIDSYKKAAYDVVDRGQSDLVEELMRRVVEAEQYAERLQSFKEFTSRYLQRGTSRELIAVYPLIKRAYQHLAEYYANSPFFDSQLTVDIVFNPRYPEFQDCIQAVFDNMRFEHICTLSYLLEFPMIKEKFKLEPFKPLPYSLDYRYESEIQERDNARNRGAAAGTDSGVPDHETHYNFLRTTIPYARAFGRYGRSQYEFAEPSGVLYLHDGCLAVCDCRNHRILVYAEDGQYQRTIGEPSNVPPLPSNNEEMDKPFPRTFGCLYFPYRMAQCPKTRRIVVVERPPGLTIEIFEFKGKFISSFGSLKLKSPRGLTVDENGYILIVESKTMKFFIFAQDGTCLRQVYLTEHLEFPNDVAARAGRIYISDNRNHCVKIFDYELDFVGVIGDESLVYYPISVGFNHQEQMIVADNHNTFNITVFDTDGFFYCAFKSRSKHANCYNVALHPKRHELAVTTRECKVLIFQYTPQAATVEGAQSFRFDPTTLNIPQAPEEPE